MNVIPSKALSHLLPSLPESEPVNNASRQPSSLDHIPDICRSLADGMDYCPWWRSLVATIYFNEWQAQSASGRSFDLPDFEEDPLVIAFFMFKAYGRTTDPELTRAIRWSTRGQVRSKVNMAKIRALAVSGASNEFIADMFCTTPKNVDTYLKLFFDIRPCLKSKAWMDTFIMPEFEKAEDVLTPLEVREAVWMLHGYYAGVESLCHILSGEINFADKAEIDAFIDKAKSMISVQAVMHASANLVLNPTGRASEWVKFTEIRNAEIAALQQSSPQDSVDGDGSWDEWMNEAFDRGVFSDDVKSAVKGEPDTSKPQALEGGFIEAEVVRNEPSGTGLPPMIDENGLLVLQKAFSV